MAAMIQSQHPAQDTSAARAFWQGLVSHGPLKRFFEWFFEGLAIVTVPAIIICSIIIAGALSAPSAFANVAGQALIDMAIILMNAAIEGAMIGCAVAARRTGLKRLYWTAIVFLVLTIATIGFAVFHVDAQWSQVLLWVRCSVALVYACVTHMSDAQPVVTPAPQQANGEIEELRSQITALTEQITDLQSARNEPVSIEETPDETIEPVGLHLVETVSTEASEQIETAKPVETAQQRALRVLKKHPNLTAAELAKRADCTPQYAGKLLKKQANG